MGGNPSLTVGALIGRRLPVIRVAIPQYLLVPRKKAESQKFLGFDPGRRGLLSRKTSSSSNSGTGPA